MTIPATRKKASASQAISSALFLVADSDLVVASPESLVAVHGARFALAATPLPFDVPLGNLFAVTTRAALQGRGVAWLVDRSAA